MLKPITQPHAIDVTNWPQDEEFSNYPEGSRAKTALFPPEKLDLDFINPTKRYLFKRSHKNYPDEFWGEIIAYHVGCLLGSKVPPAFAAYNRHSEYCGALIEWFYEDSKRSFVLGGNYMVKYINNYDRKTGSQHNFETIKHICKFFSIPGKMERNWPNYWGEIFLFDALIGNIDRHQDNWGILFDVNGNANLSPFYDNGSSLGREIFTNKSTEWQIERFNKYISDGQHCLKWNLTDKKRIKHVDLIKKIIDEYPDLKLHLKDRICNFSIEQLQSTFKHFETLEIDIPLSRERSAFILRLIELRHEKLREVLI